MSSNEDSDGRWLLSAIKLSGYCVVFVELTQSRRYGDVIVMFFLSDTRHEFHPVRQDVAVICDNNKLPLQHQSITIIRTIFIFQNAGQLEVDTNVDTTASYAVLVVLLLLHVLLDDADRKFLGSGSPHFPPPHL